MGRIFNNNLFLQENGGGGAGGTTNYEDLTNKPKVNGVTLSGNKTSADLGITTLTPFPSTWPTNGKFEDLLAVIRNDTTAIKGASFLGEVTFDDLPANLGNAEVKVEILEGTTSATKVIHSVITSGNREPYRWEYTSWNSGNSNSGWISFQLPLIAGDGISIENNVISATGGADVPEDVYTQSNLLAGNGIEIVNEPVEGGIDNHTLACWHFDEGLEPIKLDSQLTSDVRGTIEHDYYKFGNGSCSGPNITIMNRGLNTSDFTVDYFFMPKDYLGGKRTYIGDVSIYINGLGFIVYFNNNKIYEFSIEQYGIWTHFAIQRKDLIYTIYVNGQSVFQSTEALTTRPATLFEALTGGSIYFYIDELRISDIARPLTPDGKFPVPTRPYSLAVPTGNKVINNTGVTSINTKKGNVTLTADDINVTYTHEGAETTTSIKAFADTVDHDIENLNSLMPVNAYTAENLIAGKNITIEKVLPEGGIDGHTLACWHFDEDFKDVISNIILPNGTLTAEHQFGTHGYSFGSPSSTGTVVTLNREKDFTIDFFIQLTSASTNLAWDGYFQGYSAQSLIVVHQDKLYMATTNGSTTSINLPNPLQLNTWNHIAFVYSFENKIISAFVNGDNIGQLATTYPVADFNLNNFNGRTPWYIDELRISDIARQLTPDGKFPVPTQPYSVAEPTGKVSINNAITKTSQLTNDSGFITSVPVATTTIVGGVKPDGTSITATADGTISATGGSSVVDQTYDPTSTNAQSGTAVAEAVSTALKNTATGTNSLTILSSTPASGSNSINIGANSETNNKFSAVALGDQARCGGVVTIAVGGQANASADYSIAIGGYTFANGTDSIAIGTGTGTGCFASGNQSIQLGAGRNSTAKTLQVWEHQLLDGNTGLIPPERLGTNYDATKTQVLKHVNGVLTWAVTSDNVTKIVKLTQAEYDQLETKDDSTFYAIVG